jgi:hypothetical protein
MTFGKCSLGQRNAQHFYSKLLGIPGNFRVDKLRPAK